MACRGERLPGAGNHGHGRCNPEALSGFGSGPDGADNSGGTAFHRAAGPRRSPTVRLLHREHPGFEFGHAHADADYDIGDTATGAHLYAQHLLGGALITGSSPPSAAGTYAVTVTSSNGVASAATQRIIFVFADHEDDHDPVCVAQRRVHRSAGHAHSDGQPGAKRGNGDLHHQCGGPKPVNTVTGTATCTAAIAPNAGLPTSYSGFGVFAPSVGQNPVRLAVWTPTFWLATADGRVLGYNQAKPLGNVTTTATTGKVVGMASTADGQGYWVARPTAR